MAVGATMMSMEALNPMNKEMDMDIWLILDISKKMTNNEIAVDSFQDSLPSGCAISSMAMGATMMGMEAWNPMAMDLSYIISETNDK